MARANWLNGRVQGFKYRRPILEQIGLTLSKVQHPKIDLTDQISTLQHHLAPNLQAAHR